MSEHVYLNVGFIVLTCFSLTILAQHLGFLSVEFSLASVLIEHSFGKQHLKRVRESIFVAFNGKVRIQKKPTT